MCNIGERPSVYKNRSTFQRLHERGRYAGSGIGLAIVKKIIERHGGKLRIESEEGQGSCFSFSLPAVDASETPGPS